jgi:hypothetical protein
MTKKDFKVIATALRLAKTTVKTELDYKFWLTTVTIITEELTKEYSNFNSAYFITHVNKELKK